jgi:hypothetical protein
LDYKWRLSQVKPPQRAESLLFLRAGKAALTRRFDFKPDVLACRVDADDEQLVGANGRSYRLRVHQATGMIAVQAQCELPAALDLLVAYAALHECTVDDAASDVIERRVRFDT